MTTRIIFAGSGGQGIQFSGKQMAKTGMYMDKNVTFLPSYGPEMRGGTSNCTVVIADEEIGSPNVSSPDILVVIRAEDRSRRNDFLRFHAYRQEVRKKRH